MINTTALLDRIRSNEPLSAAEQNRLLLSLSLPAILAQCTSLLMQFIDAAMVGHYGASEAASIGLVTSSVWLFWSLCSALVFGFSVQVAQRLGANDASSARTLLAQSLVVCLSFSALLMLIGVAVHGPLPQWLGGDATLQAQASTYFLLTTLFLPAVTLSSLCGAMLRSAGNMILPSLASVLLCVLDVVLNYFLIFPSRTYDFAGLTLTVYGADMGVAGAAWGTGLAQCIVSALLLRHLCMKSPELRLGLPHGGFIPTVTALCDALAISVPIAIERIFRIGVQIGTMLLVAPLGPLAIAAHSFAVVAEGICYMPGFGIGQAATTLVGQSIGAGRPDLTRALARRSLILAMTVMGIIGAGMFFWAPAMMALFTDQQTVIELGAQALRIEAFAEPLFAASIVCYSIFIGAGHTKIPCLLNLSCMWLVRLSIAAALVSSLGLAGIWLGMSIELCVRGALLLGYYRYGRWLRTPST